VVAALQVLVAGLGFDIFGVNCLSGFEKFYFVLASIKQVFFVAYRL